MIHLLNNAERSLRAKRWAGNWEAWVGVGSDGALVLP